MLNKLNRKGQGEHPHAVFYILFTVILMILSIVIIFSLASNMNVETKYSVFNLRYNAIAARLLYSPKCLATETTYTGELGPRKQVHPLVVDMQKVKDRTYGSCIDGMKSGEEYDFAIAKLLPDKSLAYYNFGDDAFTSVKDNYCDGDKWDRKGTYFIVVNEAGEYSRGILNFCMEDK